MLPIVNALRRGEGYPQAQHERGMVAHATGVVEQSPLPEPQCCAAGPRGSAYRLGSTGCEKMQQGSSLFDHLVGDGEKRWRHREP